MLERGDDQERAPSVAPRDEWLAARRSLLLAEKEFTRLRDELSARRRELPWVAVQKAYVFEGPDGPRTLSDLFEGRGQLVVYHFMFGPDWDVGCKSCSFWADHFDGMIPHLRARDTTLVAVSRAPIAKLQAQARRLGWRFPWLSSLDSDFNFDFAVSFLPSGADDPKGDYNFAPRQGSVWASAGPLELPGISVFTKDASGRVFHTYSTYARGLDLLNGAYNILDLTPSGRGEAAPGPTMGWVRLHDEYAA